MVSGVLGNQVPVTMTALEAMARLLAVLEEVNHDTRLVVYEPVMLKLTSACAAVRHQVRLTSIRPRFTHLQCSCINECSTVAPATVQTAVLVWPIVVRDHTRCPAAVMYCSWHQLCQPDLNHPALAAAVGFDAGGACGGGAVFRGRRPVRPHGHARQLLPAAGHHANAAAGKWPRRRPRRTSGRRPREHEARHQQRQRLRARRRVPSGSVHTVRGPLPVPWTILSSSGTSPSVAALFAQSQDE